MKQALPCAGCVEGDCQNAALAVCMEVRRASSADLRIYLDIGMQHCNVAGSMACISMHDLSGLLGEHQPSPMHLARCSLG